MEAAGLRSLSSLLIITGSMGSGKTAVMAEASDILRMRGIPHAAIDLDILGLAQLPDAAPSDDVMYRNLQAVAQNYAALGLDRFLLARAVKVVRISNIASQPSQHTKWLYAGWLRQSRRCSSALDRENWACAAINTSNASRH